MVRVNNPRGGNSPPDALFLFEFITTGGNDGLTRFLERGFGVVVVDVVVLALEVLANGLRLALTAGALRGVVTADEV